MNEDRNSEFVERIHHGLVVSCQAWPQSPLHGPIYMSAMARAAAQGGAAGIRVNGVEDVEAVRRWVSLPLIGIQKWFDAQGELWITPTFDQAAALAEVGADIIAIDGLHAERPDGVSLQALIARVQDELGLDVMLDISNFEQAEQAVAWGADLVATTFAIQERRAPDFELLARLVEALPVPVVAEGLYWWPEQVCRAFELGAHAVVVGTAITRPDEITARFVRAMTDHFGDG